MDLKNLLSDERPDLHRHIQDVRCAAKGILDAPLHHHYTDHSVKHSERVIEILNGLTEASMNSDQRLSATEIYILLAAAYLHDIGMQDRRSVSGTGPRTIYPGEAYYDAYIAELERIRSWHHEFTRELIWHYICQNDGYVDVGLPRIPIYDEKVALVAEAHRKVALSDNTLEAICDERGTPVRPFLLAALLRFADELDIDHRRVHIDRLELISPPIDSRFYWYLCHYVHTVHIQNELITIWYRYPEGCHRYEKLIEPLVEDSIRTKLGELTDIFWSNGIKPAVSSISKRLFSELLEPLARDVEEFATERLNRLKQKEVDRLTSETLPSLPDPLASEMLHAPQDSFV